MFFFAFCSTKHSGMASLVVCFGGPVCAIRYVFRRTRTRTNDPAFLSALDILLPSLPFPFPRYVYPAYTFKLHGAAFLKSRAQLMYSGVRFPRCRRTPRTRLRPLVGFYAPVDSTAYTPRDSAHMRARPNAFTSIYPKRRALSFSRSFCL